MPQSGFPLAAVTLTNQRLAPEPYLVRAGDVPGTSITNGRMTLSLMPGHKAALLDRSCVSMPTDMRACIRG